MDDGELLRNFGDIKGSLKELAVDVKALSTGQVEMSARLGAVERGHTQLFEMWNQHANDHQRYAVELHDADIKATAANHRLDEHDQSCEIDIVKGGLSELELQIRTKKAEEAQTEKLWRIAAGIALILGPFGGVILAKFV